jgi:hypothetical protein
MTQAAAKADGINTRQQKKSSTLEELADPAVPKFLPSSSQTASNVRCPESGHVSARCKSLAPALPSDALTDTRQQRNDIASFRFCRRCRRGGRLVLPPPDALPEVPPPSRTPCPGARAAALGAGGSRTRNSRPVPAGKAPGPAAHIDGSRVPNAGPVQVRFCGTRAWPEMFGREVWAGH